MPNVTFNDYSMEVKAALNDATIAWLHTWASEIESQAKRNCKMATEGDALGIQLKGSYSHTVDESKGEAVIGSPLEAVYWEEFGTGEHAAHGDGRKGWWVYIVGYQGNGGETYETEDEAAAIAASLRAEGHDAHHTNGREPNYTLETAFKRAMPNAKADLERILWEELGE